MENAELKELKETVRCAAVLEYLGFALDRKESTRNAMKYRRDAAVIIVIHEGKGWFDPLSDSKGDVFRLIEHLKGASFVEAMHEVAGWSALFRQSRSGSGKHGNASLTSPFTTAGMPGRCHGADL